MRKCQNNRSPKCENVKTIVQRNVKKCENNRSAKCENVKTIVYQNVKMSNQSFIKMRKCQNNRSAKCKKMGKSSFITMQKMRKRSVN